MTTLLRLAHTRPSLRRLLLPMLRLGANVHLEEALEELHEPLVGWVFYNSVSDKKELFERYHALSPVHKQALAQAVSAAMKHSRTVMYRRMKSGQSPGTMGGQSLSLHNPRMGEVHAFEVEPSDILLHPGVPDTALTSKAFGHEREAILKLDAKPRHLGLVYTNERGDVPL